MSGRIRSFHRWMALFLCVVMCVSLLPVSAFAEEWAPDAAGEVVVGEEVVTVPEAEEPTDPAEPADPADPADPAGPADPADPADPVDPVDPEDPEDEQVAEIEGEEASEVEVMAPSAII